MTGSDTSSSNEHLRTRIAELENELAMARDVLAAREAARAARMSVEAMLDEATLGDATSGEATPTDVSKMHVPVVHAPVVRRARATRRRRAEETALVTRVALRHVAAERARVERRLIGAGVVMSLLTMALTVLAVRYTASERVAIARPVPALRVALPPLAPAPATAEETLAEPVPPPGALTVVCQPACTSIEIDGAPFGAGGVTKRAVAAGRHVVVLRAGGVTKRTVVDIRADETTELRVAMSESAAPPPPSDTSSASNPSRWGF